MLGYSIQDNHFSVKFIRKLDTGIDGFHKIVNGEDTPIIAAYSPDAEPSGYLTNHGDNCK